MKQMLFREKTVNRDGMTIRRREYIKNSVKGWTWDKKYKYHSFPSHKSAANVLNILKEKVLPEGYRLGIEPIDELHYALIP